MKLRLSRRACPLACTARIKHRRVNMLSRCRHDFFTVNHPFTTSSISKEASILHAGNTHNNRSEDQSNGQQCDKFLQKIDSSISNSILPQIYQTSSKPRAPLVMLLGVSGGCDSIAMFHSILRIMEKNGDIFQLKCGLPCQVHVVHFDHRQRGKESDGDRMLVEDLCKQHNVEFHCFYWDENNEKSLKFSQEVARDWRRSKSVEVLKTIIGPDNIKGVIFTAHHKDDSEETMLLKILRGVHITNISGMDSVQKIKDGHNLYFAKPMLGVRKYEISDFLTQQNLPWREDESNVSGKYLRNRVRNELIPLINDLVGGSDVLETRLENIEEQSRKLKNDVSKRADDYLKSFPKDKNDGYFVLPAHRSGLTVVEEEALFKWVKSESNGSITLSYEKLKAICQQVSKYPDRQQWKINIGDHWTIARNGEILILLYPSPRSSAIRNNELESTNAGHSQNGWTLSVKDSITVCESDANNPCLEIVVPTIAKETDFSIKSVAGNESLRFLPPWRHGKSEMKIKEFLRGQKVPLHRRGEAVILCVKVDGEERIVAVCIEATNGDARWITHADFNVNSKKTPDNEIKHIVLTRL